jgi:hypothetical protein
VTRAAPLKLLLEDTQYKQEIKNPADYRVYPVSLFLLTQRTLNIKDFYGRIKKRKALWQ